MKLHMERRTFLARITQFFSACTAGLFALPVFRFLKNSLPADEQAQWISVLNVEQADFSEGVIKANVARMIRDGWLERIEQGYVWVHQTENGSYQVFEPHCTHLGCAYAWNVEADRFECPCHGGKFRADGARISGPPKRPLDQFETRVENNILKIGKLRKA